MKVMLCAFYTPGIRAIEYLAQQGLTPGQIHLLSHDLPHNQTLLALAGEHGIETRTWKAKSPEALEWARDFQPDVIFSMYYREIIPPSLLDLAPLGAVNLHPALLPKYRGTFSAPWAIINGEKVTGFTYHYMLAQVDAGKIVLQRPVEIRPRDTAYSLYHRLLVEGTSAFGEVFRRVTEERCEGAPQVGEPSYYPRKVPFEGVIDPRWPREQIDRFIRAMYFPPMKGALARLKDGGEQEVLSIEAYDQLAASGKLLVE